MNNFELKIGYRYLKTKQKNSFTSFISIISIIGIAIGVAALITVLSVMNGFQREIRNKITDFSSDMQISSINGYIESWTNLIPYIQSNKNITGYAPYVEGQGLANANGSVNGVLIRGIDTSLESNVDKVTSQITDGSINDLSNKGTFNIVIGDGLAKTLGLSVDNQITIITPQGQITPAGMIPRVKQFNISGIFKSRMYEYDTGVVFINIDDAKTLFKTNGAVNGIKLKVNDVMNTQNIKADLQQALPAEYVVNDWVDMHQNYFSAVKMEKRMMFVILTLIIAVAAFNLVSTLVMSVNDKRADIAILRTMGATKTNIRNIFIIQGGLAGVLGTLLGTFGGTLLAFNVGRIVSWIESLSHANLISGDVYLINYLPSEVKFSDIATIFIISIVLSLLATLYPSYNAAKTNPAEALRHE